LVGRVVGSGELKGGKPVDLEENGGVMTKLVVKGEVVGI